MALTDKSEPKEESKETLMETDAILPSTDAILPSTDAILPSDIPPPLRRVVTAEEGKLLMDYLTQPAREPSEALKAAVRHTRKMMAERLEP